MGKSKVRIDILSTKFGFRLRIMVFFSVLDGCDVEIKSVQDKHVGEWTSTIYYGADGQDTRSLEVKIAEMASSLVLEDVTTKEENTTASPEFRLVFLSATIAQMRSYFPVSLPTSRNRNIFDQFQSSFTDAPLTRVNQGQQLNGLSTMKHLSI